MLEKNRVKRFPIVHDGQLVGIVSWANLVQAIATIGSKLEIPMSDSIIRERLLTYLNSQGWAHTVLLTATVNDGVVDLWGSLISNERQSASMPKAYPAYEPSTIG
jgi:signal-transduction protein with cAMP-binding, CBS, and nucleotidyltransferase domain